MSTMLSDEDLVHRIRGGDREAYGLLAARHDRRLSRFARRLVRDPRDAEDAVQGAHVLALSHIEQYQGRSPFIDWIRTITRNEVRTRFRRSRVAAASVELRDCYVDPLPTPEEWALGGDVFRVVSGALSRMPRAYSLVFRLRALSDLSTAETSRRLGVSEACVKSRLLRARSMLREAVEKGAEKGAGGQGPGAGDCVARRFARAGSVNEYLGEAKRGKPA